MVLYGEAGVQLVQVATITGREDNAFEQAYDSCSTPLCRGAQHAPAGRSESPGLMPGIVRSGSGLTTGALWQNSRCILYAAVAK